MKLTKPSYSYHGRSTVRNIAIARYRSFQGFTDPTPAWHKRRNVTSARARKVRGSKVYFTVWGRRGIR